MKRINYKVGKRTFSKLLIKISVPIYINLKLFTLKTKAQQISGSVPYKGGVLIAAHHEDDADPFIIKKAIKRRLNWISASKVFGESILDHRFLKWFIDLFGVISIDKENPARNKGFFYYVAYLLSMGEAVVIFPEGNLMNERNDRRLGAAKDGVIRLAQFAQKKINKKVPIYPVGIEYRKNGRHKDAFIRIGSPFLVNNEDNPKTAISRLMRDVARLSNIKPT
jgi:1-acyl-sn-glycerol-3-phosphate acyltransferase